MLHVPLLIWLREQGKVDELFVRFQTQGLEETLRIAEWYAPSTRAVAEHCGVDEQDLLRFYRWFADTEQVLRTRQRVNDCLAELG